MKFFLSSMAISDPQGKYFIELVGKEAAQDITIALIENAGDPYEEDKKQWKYANRDNIKAHGFQVDLVDLKEYRQDKEGLLPRLEKADAIWLGGGNTYYLRWILRETDADTVIKKLVAEGKVYGGGSAGAIVAGPTTKHFETIDDPKIAPTLIYEGLGLIDTVVVPHWEKEGYEEVIRRIEENLQEDGFDTVHITDDQALIIDGDSQEIVP